MIAHTIFLIRNHCIEIDILNTSEYILGYIWTLLLQITDQFLDLRSL